MRVTFDQCDSTDEIVGLFNKVFDNQQQMEAKIVQNAQEIEALKPKEKPKEKPKPEPKAKPKAKPEPKKKGKKMKSKGSASMRVIAILMLIVAIAGLGYAAYVPTDINYDIASNPESLSIFLRDVLGNMASDSYLFNPRVGTNPPPLAQGRVWYNTTAVHLQISLDGTSWTNIDAAGGNSLDTAYDLNHAITVDGTAVTLTVPDNASTAAMIIAQNDTTNNPIGLDINNAGVGVSIDIEGTGGYDIQGTGDLWEVSVAGIGDFTGLIVGATDLVFVNAEAINNDGDNIFQFTSDQENFSLDLSAGNIVGFSSDSAAVTLEFNALDNLTGIQTITFDEENGTISLDSGGTGGRDLLITQLADAGGDDSSLILNSAGSGDDAIIISSSSGIDVDAAGSIVITSTENAADSIVIQSTIGGIDILCDAAGAGEDIDIANTAGSVNISSTENDPASIVIQSTLGGIDIRADASGAEDIDISNTGGSVHIVSDLAGATAFNLDVTGAGGGVDIDTTNGPITLTTAGAANGDILIDASDKITIVSSDAEAAGILIQVDGGASETIHINSTAGTSAAAINIDADVGGITLLADGAAAGDILIDAEDKITILSTDAQADGIDIEVDGGAAGTIHIHNDAGTAVDSIELITDDGGITLQTGLASGILIITATYEHKVKYFPIGAGIVSASEITIGGGSPLLCVGLAAGVAEIGSTEGYAQADDETDYIRFSLSLPDDFVNVGGVADLIFNFDIDEQTNEVCNISVQIYEYDGDANVGAFVDDDLTVADDDTRAMKTFATLTTGVGAVAGLEQGDHLIFVLSGDAAADDFNLYGIEMIYRCGLAATQ